MNYNEKFALYEAHAAKIQANAYALWLAESRAKELREQIAENNPVLAGKRKEISERAEALRQEQIELIKSLNFMNQAIQDLTTKKQILWQELRNKF